MRSFTLLLLAFLAAGFAQAKDLIITLEEGERFWGGCVTDGRSMPYGAQEFERRLLGSTQGNQAQPLLLSSRGRFVWSEEPFAFIFKEGKLEILDSTTRVFTGKAGTTLRDAYRHVSKEYFPSTGQVPDERLFTKPQYNTWIELIYDQREERIRKCASEILDNGFPPGVLMIDDNWQEDYGVWDFHPGRFKNPKGMIEDLHSLGFPVMLWVCPYVSPDCETFREIEKRGYLLRNEDGPHIQTWWNGYSGSLDLTNPAAVAWFREQLDRLTNEYGVDGFKFDAGDASSYTDNQIRSHEPISPNEHSERWAQLGLSYPLNEYRACWKMAGQPLAQRLRDKGHTWQDLQQLIPDSLALGLMGYAYACPDMIGGGEYSYFYNKLDKPLDEELVVRYAQCSALMPMMQFSVAPWRVLGAEGLAECRRMAKLHEAMGPKILAIAKEAARTGEPMVRAMEYSFPGQGYATVKDQFLLGDDILVAPVLEKGRRDRTVFFPPGTWHGDDGSVVIGPTEAIVSVPLSRLPWYRKK